jgi:hypothetical protein
MRNARHFKCAMHGQADAQSKARQMRNARQFKIPIQGKAVAEGK